LKHFSALPLPKTLPPLTLKNDFDTTTFKKIIYQRLINLIVNHLPKMKAHRDKCKNLSLIF
ncbi:MAG: hypothetical protein QW279_07980, partial [Candidatus Jordarchaeaceae archaeon]